MSIVTTQIVRALMVDSVFLTNFSMAHFRFILYGCTIACAIQPENWSGVNLQLEEG